MEVWKILKKYNNYEVSNLGNVRSLNYRNTGKKNILKQSINAYNYFTVNLSKNGIPKSKRVHQLVAEAFLNHNPNGYKLVVNHKDFNRQNNNIDNLEIVTQRENSNKKHIKSSSQYVGVTWSKQMNKWKAHIGINGKIKYLGLFNSEIEASNAYQNALTQVLKQAL